MPIRYDSRNKRWRFEFDRAIAGQRHRTSRLLPKGWTQAQAQVYDQRESARLYAVATGVQRTEPLIEDAVLLYLRHHAPSLKSFRNIEGELAACLPAYAGRHFTALPEIAATYRPEGIAIATVRNRLAYVRAACRYGWKQHGMGEHDPAERMTLPRVNNARHVYLTREQFLAVCRSIPPGPKRAGVRVAFYSGMRAAEPRKSAVLPDGSAFRLADSKNGEPRLVPVHPRIAHIVRNPELWPLRHTRWTYSIVFKKAATAAGLGHARLHDLRHSTASEMVNAGVDLYAVGGVLGHKSAASTRRYAHLQTERLAAALGTVGRKLRTTRTG